MSNNCVCTGPPSVANGASRYTGSYTNGSKAEYDCNADFTNTGGSSLLCSADDDACTTSSWGVDATDTNSGYPNCQAVVPDYDVFNTYNTDSSSSGLGNWGLFGLLAALLLLLLIAVILLLWYWCCREQCRSCCIRSCPCCRSCCYQIPYSGHRYSPDTKPAAKSPNNTPMGSTQKVYHSNSTRQVQPQQQIYQNDNQSGLQPRDYVSVEQDKVYKNAKPIDNHGNPLWMPHNSNMRVGPNHIHSSTK